MHERRLPPTVTLARLYADQGYWRVAAEIYRELTLRQPECGVARQALAEMEERLALRRTPNWKEICLLLRQWAALVKQDRRRQNRSLHSGG
jgi:hypothetical protein